MPSHPLFTDKTIALSASVAVTVGLEEAVLLTILNDAASLQGNQWIRLHNQALRNQLPFWDDVSIRRVLRSLIDQNQVHIRGDIFPEGEGIIFAFADSVTHTRNQPSAPQAQTQVQARSASQNQAAVRGHQPLTANWQPQPDTLKRIEQHGIPAAFAMHHLDSFILRGQEQGANRSDWNHRFFQFVKGQWVYTQNDANRQRSQDLKPHFQRQAQQTNGNERSAFKVVNDEAKPINNDWQPSPDACQILQRAGIDPQFIDDAVAEFVLYWAERGDAFKTWNSKFIQQVRQQWARYSASVEHSPLPTRISENWQPAEDCFDILSMGHIDPAFARNLIPEFVLYWRDSNQVHTSWNSRYLQYVKQQWGKRLSGSGQSTNQTGLQHGEQGAQQTAAQPGYATAEASVQRLQDTSWAD